jgi:hypothetical protein
MQPIRFDSRRDQCWYQGDRRIWDGCRVKVELVDGNVYGVFKRSELQAGRWWIKVRAWFAPGGQDDVSLVPKDGMLVKILNESP